jgi:signal transduction histidine kinase
VNKPVIICVDDEKAVLSRLQLELMVALGDEYLIEAVEGGEEALALFNELLENNYEIPLIISGCVMHGMQGDELLKHIHAELPLIFCYPDNLNQVWTNLINNALQAMKNKGTLQIDVSVQNHYAVVSITDSGPGIPDDIKPKIFEPFFTTKPAGDGCGLGLDIVKNIIDKHDGKITVTTKPGKTTFNVYLPIN